MGAGQPPNPRQFGHEFVDIEQAEIAQKADEARQLHDTQDADRAEVSSKGTRRRWFRFLRRH